VFPLRVAASAGSGGAAEARAVEREEKRTLKR
jgi:hypothetical protein